MTRTPQPRTGRFYGMPISGDHLDDTWLESEEFCYPGGGMSRRARVRIVANAHYPTPDVPVGTLRVVTCGIPDTYFSIPARLRYRGATIRGFVSVSDDNVDECTGEYTFTPYPVN